MIVCCNGEISRLYIVWMILYRVMLLLFCDLWRVDRFLGWLW